MKGEVEMDALVMDGRTLASGAVSAVRNVANPIQLARLVMDKVPGGGSERSLSEFGGHELLRDQGTPGSGLRHLAGKFYDVSFQTSHACLTAEGASQFARSVGIPEVSQESLITEYARMRWRKNLAPDANPVECQM